MSKKNKKARAKLERDLELLVAKILSKPRGKAAVYQAEIHKIFMEALSSKTKLKNWRSRYKRIAELLDAMGVVLEVSLRQGIKAGYKMGVDLVNDAAPEIRPKRKVKSKLPALRSVARDTICLLYTSPSPRDS